MTNGIRKLSLLTRRTLLQTGGRALAALSILGLAARKSIAAKVSKAAAGYQDSPKGDQRCANCRQFIPPNACRQIDGNISPNGWCRIWAKASG
jgi:High potential iron-sulfur protein